MKSPPYPSPICPWYVVFMLMLLYIVSFLDRSAISLVIDPLKADLGVSDPQVSLLEATLMPSAYSVISDYFPRRKLPRAYVFMMLGEIRAQRTRTV